MGKAPAGTRITGVCVVCEQAGSLSGCSHTALTPAPAEKPPWERSLPCTSAKSILYEEHHTRCGLRDGKLRENIGAAPEGTASTPPLH